MRASATGRLLAIVGIAACAAFVPACFFPDYTFDLTTSATASGSGGTGTTSASTTSSTTTSNSGGTGGMHVTEDCLNGVDDNGDGKIDCEDPDCQAYECVESVPVGWGSPGYVAVYEGAAGQSPPDCPSDMPTEVYAGNATPNAQPASCAPCGCAPPTGQECQFTATSDLNPKSGIQPMQVGNQPCGTAATQLNPLSVPDPPWGGACFHAESLPGGQTCLGAPCNTSVQSAVPVVQGGTCMPTGGTATKPPATWALGALACHGSKQGGGCPSAQVCLPKPANPFKPRVCIEKPGDIECPMGSAFSKKSVYYDGLDDSRDCTGCNCGSPSGGSCEVTLTLYNDQAVGVCTNPVGSFKAGQCFNLSGNPGIYGYTDAVTKAPSGSTCQPTLTTMPVGGVSPKNPTTFCCL